MLLNKLQKIIHLSVKEVTTEVMQGTVEEIREGASDDEITDVSISCDGTRQAWFYVTQWSCNYNVN